MSGRDNAPLILFLSVAFSGSILLSLLIGLTGGHASPWIALSPLSMLIPALAVLAVRLRFGTRLHFNWKLPLLWLPIALFVIPLTIHSLALPGVIALEGKLPWVDWLAPQAGGLYHTPAQRGWGVITGQQLAARIAINAIVGILVVAAMDFFEEIGWRAFLLPTLVRRCGVQRASVLTALIWAIWHIPYALSGLLHIDNIGPVILAILHSIGTFGVGIFLAFLWIKTESVLLVSLAHGSLNNWGQYAFKFMKTTGEHDTALLAIVSLAALIVGAVSLFLLKNDWMSSAIKVESGP